MKFISIQISEDRFITLPVCDRIQVAARVDSSQKNVSIFFDDDQYTIPMSHQDFLDQFQEVLWGPDNKIYQIPMTDGDH